jgi:hypothetical protein
VASLCFWRAQKCPNPSLIEGLIYSPIFPYKAVLVKTNWLAQPSAMLVTAWNLFCAFCVIVGAGGGHMALVSMNILQRSRRLAQDLRQEGRSEDADVVDALIQSAEKQAAHSSYAIPIPTVVGQRCAGHA